LAVQLGRVVQEVERGGEDLAAGVELVAGGLKLTGDLLALGPDGGQLGAELVLGPVLFGGQVEEVALLAVELGEPARLFPTLTRNATRALRRHTLPTTER
jgi:hypothetical protein